jgi:hypothetical protein
MCKTILAVESSGFEDLFRISCGACKVSSRFLAWQRSALGVELPVNQFQCPACGYAFQRTAHAPADRRPTVYGIGKNRWVAYPTGQITLDRVQGDLVGNEKLSV